MIGVGITVHNRNETAIHTLEQIKKYAPDASKIVVVDDASKIPFEGSNYRFNVNVGISVAKNKCLELLDDCEHIFLFDDDCYPIVKDWHIPYITSGINHLSFTFDKLINGKPNGNRLINKWKGFNIFANPCGCMVYFTKKCLEVAGGFNTVYNRYGFEHADLSIRIHNLKLTPFKYMDVQDSLSLFRSLDYEASISSSVHNRLELINSNKKIFNQMQTSREFVPYKEIPKKENGNVILTSYFNYSTDPQRGRKWKAQISELMPLIESCIKHHQKLIIFSNCFVDTINSPYVTFEKTVPSQTHSPNVYRWIVYNEWMKNNTFDKCWMVDSTDVELLKEPFKIIKEGHIYCGDEIDMITDNAWMRHNQERYLKINDYRDIISKYANETLINCGIVGGAYNVLSEVIGKWSSIHKEKTKGLYYSTDMAIFNYVIRKYFNDKMIHGSNINTKFKHFEKDNKIAIWKHK